MKSRHWGLIFLFSLLLQVGSPYIYNTPSIFYSQMCRLGTVTGGSTYTCTASTVQSNIIRVGVALAQFSKAANYYTFFVISVNNPGSTATSFTMPVGINYPSYSLMKLSVNLIIIKSQPTPAYIDFIAFSQSSGSLVDNTSASDRTEIENPLLPSTFPTTTGLTFIPFVTCFRMSFRVIPGTSNPDLTGYMEFHIFTVITSGANYVSVRLLAKSQTKITTLRGILLIFDPAQINSNPMMKYNDVLYDPYPSAYSLKTPFKDFGPNFDTKCIFGFYKFKSIGSSSIDLSLIDNSYGHFDKVLLTADDGNVYVSGVGFCFGQDNPSVCGDYETYTDPYDAKCYYDNTCPLPTYIGYGSTTQCPKCAQLICTSCDAATRKICSACGPNSSVNGAGTCVCDTNYLPVMKTISSGANGLWNGQTSSLQSCKLDCTATTPNCDTCTVFPGACTLCLTGYFLVSTNPLNQQCSPCPTSQPNCLQYSSTNICTKCDTGFYLSGCLCEACSNSLPNCLQCSSSTVCSSCSSGYTITASNQCQCDPSFLSLSNCLTCTIPSQCTACSSNSFYINPSDHLCISCSNIHPYCSTCSNSQTCTACTLPFYLATLTNGTITCQKCRPSMPNCADCTYPNICTDCVYSYGLTATATCKKCSDLLNMPLCQTCDDSTGCTGCNSQSVMISGYCYQCKTFTEKCQSCVYNVALSKVDCTGCVDGYFIDTLPNGEKYCRLCLNYVNYCADCIVGTCLSCMTPYTLDSNGQCTLCQSGYTKVGQYCMNMAGCISFLTLKNLTEICLACSSELHFVYDQKFAKCNCASGFKSVNVPGSLSRCEPVCGDGIILTGIQQCDDGNTRKKDGCNEFCIVQKDFKCSSEPSKCVLYMNFNIFFFNYAQRVLGENRGILSYTILPKHQGFETVDWSKILKFNFSASSIDQSSLSYSYSSETGQLLISLEYKQQLENIIISSTLTFDPNFIVSKPQKLTEVTKLNGVNAPLAFQPQLTLQTYKGISFTTMILSLLLLIQFCVGSYFHKMIGLETIQVIQSIYFSRMIIQNSSTSLIQSLNFMEYSAAGYENAKILFGQNQEIKSYSLSVQRSQFIKIDMNEYFLMNANLSLFPLGLIILAYVIYLCRKYHHRNNFVSSKQLKEKDKYIILRRSAQWLYNHLFFPFIMLFNLLSFFYSILELSNSPSSLQQPQTVLKSSSFSVHIFLQFLTLGIYCFQAFYSYNQYKKYKLSPQQQQKLPSSFIQKLQHDQNNLDCPNYHPAYILIYLLYYFVLSLVFVVSVLIPQFKFAIQVTLGIAVIYLVFVWCWKPYHQAADVHNQLLKVYYGTFVGFLAIEYIMTKTSILSSEAYMSLMCVIMALLLIVLICGFIRIFFERRFRLALQKDSKILKNNEFDKAIKQKLSILTNNQFLFETQINEMRKNNPSIKIDVGKRLLNEQIIGRNYSEKFYQQNQYLIRKIREQYFQQNENLIYEQYKKNILNDSIEGITAKQCEKALQIKTKENARKNSQSSMNQQYKEQLKYQQKVYLESIQNAKTRLRKQWAYLFYQ